MFYFSNIVFRLALRLATTDLGMLLAGSPRPFLLDSMGLSCFDSPTLKSKLFYSSSFGFFLLSALLFGLLPYFWTALMKLLLATS